MYDVNHISQAWSLDGQKAQVTVTVSRLVILRRWAAGSAWMREFKMWPRYVTDKYQRCHPSSLASPSPWAMTQMTHLPLIGQALHWPQVKSKVITRQFFFLHITTTLTWSSFMKTYKLIYQADVHTLIRVAMTVCVCMRKCPFACHVN